MNKLLLILALLILCLLPVQSWAVITLVSSSTETCTTDSGGSCTVTVTSTTAGSMLFAFGRTNSVSDASNGAWTELALSPDNCGEFNGRPCSLYYVLNSAASVTTMTVTESAFTDVFLAYFEYSGLATSSALIGSSPSMGTWASGGGWTSSSVTPSAGESALLLGVIFMEGTGTLTAGANYTMRQQVDNGSWTWGVEDRLVGSTTGSYTATGSTPGSGAHGALYIFKETGAATLTRRMMFLGVGP